MRRQIPTKVPFALAVCSALALGSCTEKNKKPEEEGGAAEAGADADGPGDDENEAGPKTNEVPLPDVGSNDGRPPVLATMLPHEKGVVFGHFVVPNGATVLTEAKEQLMIPAYKGFLDEAALRSMASLQLPEARKPLSQNIEISKPFGCAVVDFKQYQKAPVACTFGYKGGAKQLVADLGEQDKQADAGDHVAKYRLEGEDVFIDDLGSHVVITGYDDLFGKTRGYLQENMIDRAGKIRGDLEAVAYVADAFEFYRADLQPFMDEYEKMQQPSPSSTGHPGLDAAMKIWTDYNHKSTQQSIQSFGEMAQITAYVGIEKAGIVAGGSIVPVPGSKLETQSKAAGGGRIDPALTASAPVGTVFLASTAVKPESFDNEQAAEVRGVLAQSWGALTKQDAAQAEQAMTNFVAEYRDLYAGHSMAALVDVEQSPLFGVVIAADLASGKSARDSFHAFAKDFTPDAILGQEFSQYVSWKFDIEAVEVDGVKVDRFTLEPTPKAREMMEKEMSDKDRKQVDQWFGGLRLIAHRAELDGRVVWTMAPKAEEAFAKQAIAAQKGQGSLAGSAGVEKMIAFDPAASGVFGMDIKAGLNWLRGFEELEPELREIPDGVGNDLSDVFVVFESRADGIFWGELVISQSLIDQGKDLASKQGM